MGTSKSFSTSIIFCRLSIYGCGHGLDPFSCLNCYCYILIVTALLIIQAGLLQRMVDKIPDQFLLNTSSWRFLVPQLYRKYPDDSMLLNISAISPPSVRINVGRIDATVDLDVTVNVLDFDKIAPVACMSVVRFFLYSF